MQVSAILDQKGHDVRSVGPDTAISVALHRMASTSVGCLVVLRDDGRIAGVLSERDVVRGLSHHGNRFLHLRAHEVATPAPATCRLDDDITSVMLRMTQSRQRHLPVLDGEGHLTGVVSIGDIVKHRLDELELRTNVLRDAYLAHR
jgi:CBS domain-containing protein